MGTLAGYAAQIEARASYDLLIDERWKDGTRSKLRWDAGAASFASTVSVQAAAFLNQHRGDVSLILSAQGVTPAQYLACARAIIPCMEPGDIFGLGGWCILGKQPSLLSVFYDTMYEAIPFLAKEQVKRVHIWGVTFAKALGPLLWLCDRHGIKLSTDSVGSQTKPCFGSWGYGSWHDPAYTQPPVEIRGLERARHTQLTREWLADFPAREKKHYRQIPRQLTFMEETL